MEWPLMSESTSSAPQEMWTQTNECRCVLWEWRYGCWTECIQCSPSLHLSRFSRNKNNVHCWMNWRCWSVLNFTMNNFATGTLIGLAYCCYVSAGSNVWTPFKVIRALTNLFAWKNIAWEKVPYSRGLVEENCLLFFGIELCEGRLWRAEKQNKISTN